MSKPKKINRKVPPIELMFSSREFSDIPFFITKVDKRHLAYSPVNKGGRNQIVYVEISEDDFLGVFGGEKVLPKPLPRYEQFAITPYTYTNPTHAAVYEAMIKTFAMLKRPIVFRTLSNRCRLNQ